MSTELPSPPLQSSTGTLPVMESFYTLQGEGSHQGRAAYFIRLGGCDVGCHWCDVKESWDAVRHPHLTIGELVQQAQVHPGRLVVITGGEPLMHDLTKLTSVLQAAGFETNIETSGVHPITGTWDWICFSPKKFKVPHESIYHAADELKVVVFHPSDLQFAEEHAARVRPDCRLFLQPEWSRHAQVLPLLIDYVKDNPRWRISLQVHKFMNIP